MIICKETMTIRTIDEYLPVSLESKVNLELCKGSDQINGITGNAPRTINRNERDSSREDVESKSSSILSIRNINRNEGYSSSEDVESKSSSIICSFQHDLSFPVDFHSSIISFHSSGTTVISDMDHGDEGKDFENADELFSTMDFRDLKNVDLIEDEFQVNPKETCLEKERNDRSLNQKHNNSPKRNPRTRPWFKKISHALKLEEEKCTKR
jgi:hypothetical protein